MSLPIDTYICPVTKLPILNKPEWHKVSFGGDYKISVDIIGEQILLTHNFGTPNLNNAIQAFDFTAKIIEKYFQKRPYIHIFNYSGITKKVSLETRRYVIDKMKKRDQMLAAIYYGLNPSLKLSIKIGQFFNFIPFKCHISDDYPEALSAALTFIKKSDPPSLINTSKEIDAETIKLIKEVSHKKPPLSHTDHDPFPFDRAIELIDDEINYFEEKEGKIKQQNTLARLEKIINSRNEKAKNYRNSLRPKINA